MVAGGDDGSLSPAPSEAPAEALPRTERMALASNDLTLEPVGQPDPEATLEPCTRAAEIAKPSASGGMLVLTSLSQDGPPACSELRVVYPSITFLSISACSSVGKVIFSFLMPLTHSERNLVDGW